MGQTQIRCRDIDHADLGGVIDLLTLGFGDQRDRCYWERAIECLKRRVAPASCPRYGCLMESNGVVVGVILQIFAPVENSDRVRCNFSSWWVRPEFRIYGALLVNYAFRHEATYTNITPAPGTIPILDVQGYRRYCAGRVIACPMIVFQGEAVRITRYDDGLIPDDRLGESEKTILRDHAAAGCICLICETDGAFHLFVFAPRKRLARLGLAVLTYADAAADFSRFAGPLGRYLARAGFPIVVLDADGPIKGVPGVYFANKPKYFRGPDRPRINDHAYSERALLGS